MTEGVLAWIRSHDAVTAQPEPAAPVTEAEEEEPRKTPFNAPEYVISST